MKEGNCFDLDALQRWLDGQKAVPVVRKKVRTLMDIAGISHLENNWSDIYAYFFTPLEKHGMGRLFIDALAELVAEKGYRMPVLDDDLEVVRERVVKDNKRLDLLIQDHDSAVIIENKVNASLYNDLQLYWDSIHVREEQKCGVVLSLHPVRVGLCRDHFVNITHEELAERIKRNMPEVLLSADPKSLILLQDFLLNISNQTHAMDENAMRFFYKGDNHTMINNLSKIRTELVNYLTDAVAPKESVMNDLFERNGLKLKMFPGAKNKYVYYRFNGSKGCLMLTLLYSRLWNFDTNGCRIDVILEMQGEMMKGVEDYVSKKDSYIHYRIESIPFAEDDLKSAGAIRQKIVDYLMAEGSLYYQGLEFLERWKAE